MGGLGGAVSTGLLRGLVPCNAAISRSGGGSEVQRSPAIYTAALWPHVVKATSQAQSLILPTSHFAGEGPASERLSASVSFAAGAKVGSELKLVDVTS